MVVAAQSLVVDKDDRMLSRNEHKIEDGGGGRTGPLSNETNKQKD